jgi:hypothetical protein
VRDDPEGLATKGNYWALILPAIGLIADAITILAFLLGNVSAPSTSGSKPYWMVITLTLIIYSSIAAGFAINHAAFVRQLKILNERDFSRWPDEARFALVKKIDGNIEKGVLLFSALMWTPLFILWCTVFLGFVEPAFYLVYFLGLPGIAAIHGASRSLFEFLIGPQRQILADHLNVADIE